MKEEELVSLVCPSCGAPYRETVPSGVMQVKCRYCGGVIVVPPLLHEGVRCCPNHPDRLATGKCNDCFESFCDECLRPFELKERYDTTILYLCQGCLRERYENGAYKIIFAGIVLVLGAFLFVIAWPVWVTCTAIGVGMIFYGIWKKKQVSKDLLKDRSEIEG